MSNSNDKFWLWILILIAVMSIGSSGFIYYQLEKKRELRRPVRLQTVQTTTVVAEAEPLQQPESISSAIDKSLPLISFSMLGNTEIDDSQQPLFAEEIRRLDGQRVRMQGFMSPYDDIRNMRSFMLFSYPVGCNFCAPPAVNQVVLVHQKAGQRNYHFIDDPIEISGVLRLWQDKSDIPDVDDVTFLYQMEETEVAIWKLDDEELDKLHR